MTFALFYDLYARMKKRVRREESGQKIKQSRILMPANLTKTKSLVVHLVPERWEYNFLLRQIQNLSHIPFWTAILIYVAFMNPYKLF